MFCVKATDLVPISAALWFWNNCNVIFIKPFNKICLIFNSLKNRLKIRFVKIIFPNDQWISYLPSSRQYPTFQTTIQRIFREYTNRQIPTLANPLTRSYYSLFHIRRHRHRHRTKSKPLLASIFPHLLHSYNLTCNMLDL